MRIAFCGTPEFAVPSLSALHSAGHTLCLFTQPDRPKGRKGDLTPPPAKEEALRRGIPICQFERIREQEGLNALKSFAPDLMVTAAFGQILSAENLSIPRLGCINVHGSLLPKYRGAAPIQWAIIAGERKTGITTMFTDVGLDTGDILMMRETEIGPDETAGELTERMAVLGAEVLLETIAALEAGTLRRTPQDHTAATMCRMIKKEQGRIDFSKSAEEIHNLVRGMNPWPVAFCMLGGETVKIWKTKPIRTKDTGHPGLCVAASPAEGLLVDMGDGLLQVLELQFPGGKRLSAEACMNGIKLLGKMFQ